MNSPIFATLLCCLSLARAQESPVSRIAPYDPPVKWVSTASPGKITSSVITRDQFQPLTGKQRWGLYWHQSYWGRGAMISNAGRAVGAKLKNEPTEWGEGLEGYSKRFANRFARSAVRDSISAAGSAALGYDVRYVKCDCKGIFPRIGHSIAWNFLTLDRHGNTVLNVPRIGGTFASEFIGNTWMPAGYHTAGDAMRSGSMQLGLRSLFNVAREFVPRKKAK